MLDSDLPGIKRGDIVTFWDTVLVVLVMAAIFTAGVIVGYGSGDDNNHKPFIF